MEEALFVAKKRYTKYQKLQDQAEESSTDDEFEQIAREFIEKQKEKRKLRVERGVQMSKKYQIKLPY